MLKYDYTISTGLSLRMKSVRSYCWGLKEALASKQSLGFPFCQCQTNLSVLRPIPGATRKLSLWGKGETVKTVMFSVSKPEVSVEHLPQNSE